MSEQQTERTEATPGEQAVLGQEPVLTLGGKEYRLRKLGLDAMEPLARIVDAAMTRGVIADPSELTDPAKAPRLMIFAIAHCKHDVFDIASQLLGVPEEELHDPERFPLEDIAGVMGAFRQSRDVSAFLSTGAKPDSPSETEAPEVEHSPSDESST